MTGVCAVSSSRDWKGKAFWRKEPPPTPPPPPRRVKSWRGAFQFNGPPWEPAGQVRGAGVAPTAHRGGSQDADGQPHDGLGLWGCDRDLGFAL